MSKISFDTSSIESAVKGLKTLSKKSVMVGWNEGANYDDGTPVAGIAAQNEYGNPGRSIPARPFIRPTISSNKEEWVETLKKGATAILEGRSTADIVLGAFGDRVSAQIKNSIVNEPHTPLSPITIALRRLRDNNVPIGGATVGAVAAAIARGETGPGQLGDQTFPNRDPLRDTGYMIATLTSEVSG